MATRFLFLLSTLITVALNGQSMADLDDYASSVRSRLRQYRMVEKRIADAGSKQFYFDGKELKLVKVLVNDHGIVKQVEWFYVESKLVFAETNWIRSGSGESVFHEKYYFSKGALFAWINFEGVEEKTDSESFKTTSRDILKTAQNFLKEATQTSN